LRCSIAPSPADELDEVRTIRDSIPTEIPSATGPFACSVIIATLHEDGCPFAAVEWGWTYKCKCLDVTTSSPLRREHYNTRTRPLAYPAD